MNEQIDEFLCGNLKEACDRMKRHTDATENIKTRRPKVKWSDKCTGPFVVIKEAHKDSDSYVLDLPKSWNVYPVFHTSLLIPFHKNKIANRVQPPPPAVVINGDEEFEIEKIVDQHKRYGRMQYSVKWTGYPVNEKNDWLDEDNLAHAKDILGDFQVSHKPSAKRCKKWCIVDVHMCDVQGDNVRHP